jgi:hypothetical protein
MEEAIIKYKRERLNYDPEPLKRLNLAKQDVSKYNKKVYFVRKNNIIITDQNGEPRYFSDISTALRVLGEEEHFELQFYPVHLHVIDDIGNINEKNVKIISNLNK